MKKQTQMPCDGDERQYVMQSSRHVAVNHPGICICICICIGVGVGVEHRALSIEH